jgi:hypothetical protein
METVKFLDHYRTALTRDRLTFQILSNIFQNGASSEAELTPAGVHIVDVRHRLLNLFRANFIGRATNLRWVTTDLGNLALARMGIADRSIHWFIDAWGMPDEERRFLKSCLQQSRDRDVLETLQRQSLVKVLWQAKAQSRESEATAKDSEDALYCAIVAFDPRAESLGSDAYCDLVFAQDPEVRGVDVSLRNRIKKRVDQSLEHARACNLLFVVGQPGQCSQSVLFLAWSRLLSASSSGLADEGLRYLRGSAVQRIDDTWEALRDWKPDLAECSVRILDDAGHGVSERRRDVFDPLRFVRTRLQTEFNPACELERSAFPEFRALGNALGDYDKVLLATNLVRQLKEVLERGLFDQLAKAVRQELCDCIDGLGSVFRSRLLPEVDGCSEQQTTGDLTNG